VVILVIVKDFVEIASYYFANKIIVKCFKIFIIIVLRKKRKKNSLLSSYKLIVFKNMLVEVLKKYIVNIIFNATEKYKLYL